MSVEFQVGQELGRGDLDIFLTDSSGSPTNAYSITFAVYFVDPTTSAEVLIGSAERHPVNPSVGEYYAALGIPPNATTGSYRIRWTFKQYASSTARQVVQNFMVISTVASVSSKYSAAERAMIDKLRILLRDNCVGGEELVELDVGGERMVVRMDDLHEALHDLSPPPPEVGDAL